MQADKYAIWFKNIAIGVSYNVYTHTYEFVSNHYSNRGFGFVCSNRGFGFVMKVPTNWLTCFWIWIYNCFYVYYSKCNLHIHYTYDHLLIWFDKCILTWCNQVYHQKDHWSPGLFLQRHIKRYIGLVIVKAFAVGLHSASRCGRQAETR